VHVPDDDRRTTRKLEAIIPTAMYLELRRVARDYDSLASLVRHILRDWLRTHRDSVP
jgi:hypothetical protein